MKSNKMGRGNKPGRTGEGEVIEGYILCSRNARPQKALVGRAQWEIKQPTLL